MSIYKRRLFNRGGQVSSRGVGITSGLATPKRGYVDRPGSYQGKGEASLPDLKDKYESTLDTLRSLDIVPERKPFSRLDATAPALLNLFGGLMSGKSYEGGLGGAFDIAGQALQSSTPLFAKAIKDKQEYDATDPEATIKNLALSKALEPDPTPEISGSQVVKYVDPSDSKTKQKLTYFENGVYKEKELGESTDVRKIKGIPEDLFNGLSEANKLQVYGIEDSTGISNVSNPADVLIDGEMKSVVTYVQNNELKTKVLGGVPEDEQDKSAIERMINRTDELVGQNISDYPIFLDKFPEIFPDANQVVTEDQVKQLQSKLNLQSILEQVEPDKTISAEEQSKIDDQEFVREQITTPNIQNINNLYQSAVSRADDLAASKAAIEQFEPGAFADIRLQAGKIFSLFLDPKTLSADMLDVLDALKIGNPVAGDVLDKFSSNLTLSVAKGGALPGNLNLKEFNELKNAGLPLWTTKDGAEIMIEIYQRNDQIAFDANRMLKDINNSLSLGEKEFSIQFPDGTIKQFESYDSAVAEIDQFMGLESQKVISGNSNNYKDWNSISSKIQNLQKYDVDSLRLEDKVVRDPISNKDLDALTLEKEGKLKFVGWGDGTGEATDPNALYPGQAIYKYYTGVFWTGNEDNFDPKIHKKGTEQIYFWGSPKRQLD